MRLRDTILIATLVHGGTCPHASAQSFMRRCDALGQDDAEVAFSIERAGSDTYITIGSGAFTIGDSIYYNPVLFTLSISDDGNSTTIDTLVYEYHAIYAGWSNCMNRKPGGGFVSGGSTFSQSQTQRAALWDITEDGAISLLGEYGLGDDEGIGRQVVSCKDSGYLVAGEAQIAGDIDAMLIKTDANGIAEWERAYGTTEYFDYFLCVDTTADDNGFFAGGQTWDPVNKQQFWVLRVDAEGDTVWSKVWGSAYNEYYAHLTTKANGNPIVANSWAYGPMYLQMRAYMTELDASDGSFVWQREYGSNANTTELYTAKEVAPGEGHIAVGFTFAPNSNFFKGLLLRTADNGDSLWMRSYFYYDSLMTDGMGELKDVVPTSDGGFIACGYTNGSYTGTFPSQYSQDTWIVKVDSVGCIIPGCDIPMGITSQITNMGYVLNVYPNPLSPSKGQDQLHVAITLPSNFKTEGPLSLTVVSMEGKLVRQEVVPTSAPNEVMLDVTGLALGAYTVHLSDAHTWIAGKKFIIE